jgi:maltose/moltooligosaccharide transporter
MALAGIGWGSLVSLPYVIFCDRVDARQLGLLLGMFNLAVVIPQLVVSLGLGAIAPTLASRGDLFLIAGAALLAAGVAWSRIPPLKPTDHL